MTYLINLYPMDNSMNVPVSWSVMRDRRCKLSYIAEADQWLKETSELVNWCRSTLEEKTWNYQVKQIQHRIYIRYIRFCFQNEHDRAMFILAFTGYTG